MAEGDNKEEIRAETALGKFSISSANLNNLLTILGFVGICVLILSMIMHTTESKEGVKDLAGAMRENASAAREQNCLLIFEQKERQANADFCKRNAR